MQTSWWMVRSDSGALYEEFREENVVALGWADLSAVKEGMSRQEVVELYSRLHPELKRGTIINGASQVWRFINELRVGDQVVTYSPSARKYLVGVIKGKYQFDDNHRQPGLSMTRATQWIGEVDRDKLTTRANNTLGSTLTVFRIPEWAAEELNKGLHSDKSAGPSAEVDDDEAPVDERTIFSDIESCAREFIKDRVTKLDWDEMQELVAGVLRAMGVDYRPRLSQFSRIFSFKTEPPNR